jgi:hypothetical protein
MATKTDEEELPLHLAPRWIVEPVFKRQTKDEVEKGLPAVLKFHALFYDGAMQKKGRTEREIEQLRKFAAHCNKQGLTPRPAIQCKADTNLPAPPRKKAAEQPATEPAES